jgi:hypothetical protein
MRNCSKDIYFKIKSTAEAVSKELWGAAQVSIISV